MGNSRALRGNVLPLFIYFAGKVGTPLPPASVAATGNSVHSRPCSNTARAKLDECLVTGFNKCTHSPINGCGGMEGKIAIWNYSTSIGRGGLGHRTQDLWKQLIRNAHLSSGIARTVGPVFWFCPKCFLPGIISDSIPSRKSPGSPSKT